MTTAHYHVTAPARQSRIAGSVGYTYARQTDRQTASRPPTHLSETQRRKEELKEEEEEEEKEEKERNKKKQKEKKRKEKK